MGKLDGSSLIEEIAGGGGVGMGVPNLEGVTNFRSSRYRFPRDCPENTDLGVWLATIDKCAVYLQQHERSLDGPE